MKIEKNYVINNEVVYFQKGNNHYKLFMNKEADSLYITDKELNVLDVIHADCSQNYGYLEINVSEKNGK